MKDFLLILLALDVVLALLQMLFVTIRSHKKFYKTEAERFEPVHSIEADALRRDQTPLIIVDLDLSFFNNDKK